ncbi:hypothetical protein EYF80_043789 [Liparis tanakae]|uniref:Uncharacterized protein n=1 Tax=Liparis tanakae TaxID=230148 RepID=A0A4Z2FYJ7_9TELE|nr:hypothetical protein EYF80_043789 [Liparis tanakae]
MNPGPHKHGERRPPLPHLVPRPQSLRPPEEEEERRVLCTMNMLKSTGLKIPGRGPKHSSPVGRASAGGTSSPVIPKDTPSERHSVVGVWEAAPSGSRFMLTVEFQGGRNTGSV